MDNVIEYTDVNGKNCNGCLRTNTQILLTIRVVNDPDFHDYMLNTQQTKDLIAQLEKKLKENEE